MIPPMLQDQSYHRFADGRVFLGVTNAADVLSNLAFFAVGISGLLALWRGSARLQFPHEARAYWTLFTAVVLTAIGSAYYHLRPDDSRLVWDRLPMAVAFMSLVSTVIAERLDARVGASLLAPLVVLGVASVAHWALAGDLRLYALVQVGCIAASVAISAFWSSRYTKGEGIFVAIAAYGVAKACEAYDRAIFALTGELVSGHTAKHLAAALALYVLVRALRYRQLRARSVTEAGAR